MALVSLNAHCTMHSWFKTFNIKLLNIPYFNGIYGIKMEKGKQITDLKLELETCKQQKHKVDIVDRCTILIVCLTFCTQCQLYAFCDL